MADETGDPELPTARFGRFELVQRLDAGGMAEIFLALEHGPHDFERVVVIKQVLPHLAQKAAYREMFLQEARWVARLGHPNIVQVYELGEADGSPFIAMEHVPGVSFRDIVSTALKRKEQIPLSVAAGLMIQACAGAHAAHELADAQGQLLGLVHRDISPQNLMVTGGGHVKLLDFGIAKATELGVDTTRTGALKGKVHFMSPEQVLQQPLDRRSDVFALGIVAWELLTLRRLFKRENDMATMQAITGGNTPRPEQARAEVPALLSAAVMKSLEVDRGRRFDTAEQLRHALEAASDAAGLRWGADEVAAWVQDVMGAELAARAQSLKDAIERAKREGFTPGEPGKQRTASQTLPSFTPAPQQRTEDDTRDMRPGPQAEPSPGDSPPAWRRIALRAAIFLLSVGASAAWVWTQVSALDGPPLKVGWPPTIDAKLLAQDIEPLRKHLEQQTRRPVHFLFADSYQELSRQLVAGNVDFAALPPALLVRTEKTEPRIIPLAAKIVGGSSRTDGVLVAADGAGIGAIPDLRGKTLCVPDRESTTGMLFPRVAAREEGLELDRDVTVHVSGNHLQVLRDVLRGTCQAGATYSVALLNAVTQGVDVTGLRQVAITGHAPQDSIVAGPGVPQPVAAQLQQALLSYHPPAGRPGGAGSVERISGFVMVKPEDYAQVRALLEPPDAGTEPTPGEPPPSADVVP